MIARIELTILALVLVVGAFSTGADFLFFLLYLVLLVAGGAYVLTRLGLADLEAGYVLSQLQGTVGEHLRVTYTLRNASRLPKPWLEVEHPSNLPVALPARAISLRPRGERAWVVRVPLTRRGHYRVDPLEIRTCDPFGLFEATATVGAGTSLVVYPRVEALPFWDLPASSTEGTHASRERTLNTTPLVTSVRPYAPGDAFNRIHWPTTARQQELYVREFDLEQAADAYVYLDLERAVHTGTGDESTIEAAVRIAASVGGKALAENRALGLTASSRHMVVVPADRGARQHQKLMASLVAAQADGSEPLVEVLSRGLHLLRGGMTALIITPSLDPAWVGPLASLRARGVAAVVCHLDPIAYAAEAGNGPRRPAGESSAGVFPANESSDGAHPVGELPGLDERRTALLRIRQELTECDLPFHTIVPRRRLAELLVTPGAAALRRAG